MYKVHMYLDGNMIMNQRLDHLPRTGDTVRFPGVPCEVYGIVTEVIWCMDESNAAVGQRINLRLESEKVK